MHGSSDDGNAGAGACGIAAFAAVAVDIVIDLSVRNRDGAAAYAVFRRCSRGGEHLAHQQEKGDTDSSPETAVCAGIESKCVKQHEIAPSWFAFRFWEHRIVRNLKQT